MKIENQNIPLPGMEGNREANLEGKKVQDTGLQGAEAVKRAGENRAGAAAAGVGTGLDQLQLSSLSRSLRMEYSESPERVAYLEKLSLEVASGRYDVDPEAISRDIVEEAFGRGVAPEAGAGGIREL
jgi:anti-sigma28 factor (negative regulator of flagellin synthesis)